MSGEEQSKSTSTVPYSWIVEFWSEVFRLLGKVSISRAIIYCRPSLKNHHFVDWYVTLNTLASVIALGVVTYRRDEAPNVLLTAVTIYGALRTFEIFVYQVNVLLFDEYRYNRDRTDLSKRYEVRGYRRIVILLVHNYFEIVCWFGVLYMYMYRTEIIVISEGGQPTFFRVFRESLLLMFSFTPEKYSSSSSLGIFLFSLQATVGVFMSVLVLARFVAILPPPATMDPFEQPDDRPPGK